MKKQVILLLLLLCSLNIFAQGSMMGAQPKEGIMGNMQMDNFEVNVNQMDDNTRKKLNQVATIYRSRSRGAFTDISKSMLYGGSIFCVHCHQQRNHIVDKDSFATKEKMDGNETK